MRMKSAGLVLVSALTLGVLAGSLGHTLGADGGADPVAAASGTPVPEVSPVATPATPEPAAADVDVLAPGAAGPVQVGMSKDAALATGLMDADVSGGDGCPDLALAWKPNLRETFDVQTLGNGEIASIGVRGKEPRTADGLGVGSTADDVRDVVDEDAPLAVGFGQAGLFEFDGQTGRWIGYLFDASPARLRGSDVVTFVELTKGVQPALVRSGC